MDKPLIKDFRSIYTTSPQVVSSAPGRINLIGEHTDYNLGYVLPAAIHLRNTFLSSKNDKGVVNIYAQNFGDRDSFSMDRVAPSLEKNWVNYVRGIFWVLREEGWDIKGLDGFLSGDIPLESGLSSSAALEVCVLSGIDCLFGLGLAPEEIARMAQRVEVEWIEVHSGLMDQYVALFGKKDSSLFLDCQTLEYEHVPLRFKRRGLGILVYDSGVKRALASSEYNLRRQESAEALALFKNKGWLTYRDIPLDKLEIMKEELGETSYRRARHVITENERVQSAVQALKEDDFQLFGELMFRSHQSLRDDYQVSSPELDLLYEVGQSFSGCLGARLTGAGFGGSGIALLEENGFDGFQDDLLEAAKKRGFPTPRFHRVEIGDGVEVFTVSDPSGQTGNL